MTDQITGPIGAIAVGVAALLLIEQMAKNVPIALPKARPPKGDTEDPADGVPPMRADSLIGQLIRTLAQNTPAFTRESGAACRG